MDAPTLCQLADAIASAEQLRLVPSMRSRKGAIWNKKPFAEEFWEVELTMKISGQGRIGADGLVCSFVICVATLCLQSSQSERVPCP